MYLVTAPWWIRRFYKDCIWQVKTDEKKIFLTFDDGPHPEVTSFVLNELEKYRAKATFFCIGNNAMKHPNMMEKISAQGHAIGNHTFNHLNGWKNNNYNYVKDITLAEQFIPSKLFRPPYGRISDLQIQAIKKDFKIIMWSVLSGDFDTRLPKEKCYQNVVKNTGKGSIVVFHDSEKAFERMQYTLPKVLQYFTEKEFVFDALSL